MRNIWLLALFVTGLLQPAISMAVQPLGCLFEPDLLAEVGSPVIGIVATVTVDRGSIVRKGQVLATLRADVERASVNVANTRVKAEADVKTAEANLKLARVTQQRGEDLVSKNFISQQALDKTRAETAIAEQKLVLAREQLDVSNGELALARANLGQRSIRSPIDGIIADRYVWPGERVEEKALFKVAQIDPIRVEMVVPVALYGTLVTDMVLSVTPEIPNAQPLEARVVLVDKLIDGASNTFRIRAEIPNEDLSIPSGVRCKAELPNPPTVAAATADPFEPATGALKLTPAPSTVEPAATKPKAPAPAAPPSLPTTDVQKAVLNTVEAWAKAWSARDVPVYLACYADDFKTPSGESRAEWAQGRKERISRRSSIQVKVETPKVSIQGNRASVAFVQDYRAGQFVERSDKVLYLRQSGKSWLIEREETED